MTRRAEDRANDVVAARWRPVVVGGRDAGDGVAPGRNGHHADLPVVPQKLVATRRDGSQAEHRARIAAGSAITLHVLAVLVAVVFVQPDMQLGGDGTLAQVIQSGIVIVPVPSVAVTPSSAGAQQAVSDAADRVQPITDDTAVVLDAAAEAGLVQAETVAPDLMEAEQAVPESAADRPSPADTAQVQPDLAVETRAPAADDSETVVLAAAPDIITAPAAAESVAPAAPEPVQQPTPDEIVRPVEPGAAPRQPIAQPAAAGLAPRIVPKPGTRQTPPTFAEPPRRPASAKREAADEPRKTAERAKPPGVPAATAARPPGGGGQGRPAASGNAAGSPDLPRAAGGLRAGAKGSGGPAETIAGTALLPSYAARVQQHYARYKSYPAAARDREVRGTVRIGFTLNAAGGVTSVRLVASSGAAVLDEAAVAAARRASPFPAIPPELGRSSIPFTIPVRFSLD